MVNQQPDIFDDKSLFLVITVLQKQPDDELILLVLQLLRHATLMHETNRQNIMNAEIMTQLRPLIKTENPVVSQRIALNRILFVRDLYPLICPTGFEGGMCCNAPFDSGR